MTRNEPSDFTTGEGSLTIEIEGEWAAITPEVLALPRTVAPTGNRLFAPVRCHSSRLNLREPGVKWTQ